MIDVTLIPEYELRKFCYPLIGTIHEFFKNKDNRKEFIEWQKTRNKKFEINNNYT